MMRVLLCSIVLALVVPIGLPVLESTALADDAPAIQAKNLYDKAETSYALGKFEEALRLYEQAYEAKPLAAFLFNIGQCHRNLGNWERAAFFYQGFLSKEPKAKNRSAVLALVDQMNQKMREEKEANAQKPPETGTPVTPPILVPVTPPTVPTNPPASDPNLIAHPGDHDPLTPPPQKTPVYKKWWLWTAVGLVAVGGAVAIGVVATHPTVDATALTMGTTLRFSPTGPIDATH